MGVYQGQPFELKAPGKCSTCPRKMWGAGELINVWRPGTTRITFLSTHEEEAFKDSEFMLTFCADCAAKVDESDFEQLEDLIWRGWRRAWDFAQLTEEEVEHAVHLRRGFKILSFHEAHRADENGIWELVSLEEVRCR